MNDFSGCSDWFLVVGQVDLSVFGQPKKVRVVCASRCYSVFDLMIAVARVNCGDFVMCLSSVVSANTHHRFDADQWVRGEMDN